MNVIAEQAGYRALLANAPTPEQLAQTTPLAPFSPEAVALVDGLSAVLMRSPHIRTYPELVALGYWMRKANLERLRQDLERRRGDALLVPRGVAFHIAPGNVDTIFVYSWFLSLLSGNCNIVRLSSKPSPQAEVLVEAIGSLLARPEHAAIAARTLLLRYAPDDRITARLSAVCDVRVIWGGDSTVRQIRAVPLAPTASEVAFSNKYSLALLHAQRWLASDDQQKDALATAFYNDAYWFDQMACSSPRMVLWLPSDAEGRA
ncbi:acyl-CoA reductase, partial [Duganella phyllosphaerae]|uniref:acyl-CoA reductase n=1 Tax=Duganella phyllosphaerae TaxID=762836 RepID=UPI0023B99480